jgi:hypothetical protein
MRERSANRLRADDDIVDELEAAAQADGHGEGRSAHPTRGALSDLIGKDLQ